MPCRRGDAELQELAALLVEETASERPRDWQKVVARARAERVAPLLSGKLSPRASIPRELRFELLREVYRSAALNHVLFEELERLLEAGARLRTRPPLVLKGGALAPSLYRDVSLRPMSDIDLFVPEDELSLWLDAGAELGLEAPAPEMAPGLNARVHYQRALGNERAIIELHVGLVGGASDWRAPEPEWLWRHAEPWRSPGARGAARALQLDPTASLLYASAHALLQHGAAQAPLLWLYDVHAMLTLWGDRIDWTEVLETAPALSWGAALAETLALSRELFGSEPPEGLEEALRTSSADALHARRKADPALSRAELVWREMGCLGLGDRLRWALAILFPSPTYVRWRYPKARRVWPVCYPYRWSVVVREGLSALTAPRTGTGS